MAPTRASRASAGDVDTSMADASDPVTEPQGDAMVCFNSIYSRLLYVYKEVAIFVLHIE